MKYSLRSLMIVAILGPPLLALIIVEFRDRPSIGVAVVLVALAIKVWMELRRHKPVSPWVDGSRLREEVGREAGTAMLEKRAPAPNPPKP